MSYQKEGKEKKTPVLLSTITKENFHDDTADLPQIMFSTIQSFKSCVVIIIKMCIYIAPDIHPNGAQDAFIIPAHQADQSFLKPSQLPGEYTAQLQPF